MADESFVLEKSELSGRIDALMKEGYRLVQICCVKEPSGHEPVQRLEMNYSFDKEYSLINFKVNLSSGEPIDSITPVCSGAYLYENEIHDLFGIAIGGISVDFKGTFYKTAIPSPFNPAQGMGQ